MNSYGRELRKNNPAEPVNRELFDRTAPAWNCVAFPGEGMHYLNGDGDCRWCGMTRRQIRERKDKSVIRNGDRVRVVNAGELNGLTGKAGGLDRDGLPFVALDDNSWFSRAGMYYADDGGALTVRRDQMEAE